MSSPPPLAQPQPKPRGFIWNFWQRVSEGLALSQLWSQFAKDARSSYRLYSAGFGNLQAERSRFRRGRQIASSLFWAILEKLTPARRVLVLLGLIFLLLPSANSAYTDASGHVDIHEFDMHVWGGIFLFIALLLELADRVVMKRDLEIAKDIQAWLLPGAPLQMPGYSIAYATRPANTVAGDYYDVILRPGNVSTQENSPDNIAENDNEGRVLFVVADVAGKSIPAAMLMATFQASLRTLSSSGGSLASLVEGVNRYASSNSQGGVRFTTAFFAELDPESGSLAYFNAGHNAPILRKRSGLIERLDSGGIPLGIFAESIYQAGAGKLESGEWLAIFTDGVIEAFNSKEEEYGEEALLRLIDRESASAPEQLLRALFAELDQFVGNTPQHDDITCLLLKRT
jgi:sigma-B regulation protein RsbU (phosphoserine phosphatase)